MKKKIITLLLALALMVCVGCEATTLATRDVPSRFTKEHATGIGSRYAYIITDTETGVQYLFVGEIHGYAGVGGLCKLEGGEGDG